MTNDIEALRDGPSKSRRMLQSDVRPMERCCGHHLFAHDAEGCLITGCICHQHVISAGVCIRTDSSEILDEIDEIDEA
jgi:hypothetical protein